MATKEDFTKDFGYLHQFLKNIRAFVESMEPSSRRDELQSLLEGSPARWQRVHELLGTIGPTDDKIDPSYEKKTVSPVTSPAEKPSGTQQAKAKIVKKWTIGPLNE